ncbi:Crp/Fnr family transcriptional regulator [Aquabacterium sp.]|uniref:Crp/Fnr family transcriptional regulator n=1 Tax=Aquabacterium sp. TaxID=1872578 RepID=UPI002D81091C|nr:Crp/Fnr family transcriptional regulator [Aquabacterium sp.]
MPLSPLGRHQLDQLTLAHGLVSEQARSAMGEIARERVLDKGASLLAAGEQALHAGLVLGGVIGEFYEAADGARKAKWLARPGDVFGSLEDLVRGGPSRTSIEEILPSSVVSMPYAWLREQAVTRPQWASFFVSLLEGLYRQKSEREYALLMLKADRRYAWFRERFGSLESLLSQEIIASYLGITPVHLGRIKAATRRRSGSG